MQDRSFMQDVRPYEHLETSVLGVDPIIRYAQSKNVSLGDLLENTGIDESQLDFPSYHISIHQEFRLTTNLLNLVNEPHLGLSLGQYYTSEVFGLMAPVLSNAPNLRATLEAMLKFVGLTYTWFQVEPVLSDDEKLVSIFFCDGLPLGDLHDFFIERDLSFLKLHTDPYLDLIEGPLYKSISLKTKRPQNPNILESFFGCPIRYSQPQNCVTLYVDALNAKTKTHHSLAFKLFESECKKALKEKFNSSWQAKVTRILASSPTMPTIKDVADYFYCSERTLRRRLNSEDTNYQAVLDDVRKHRAINLLLYSKSNMDGIALELGYSEASSFTKAFERWTGFTPSSYRKERMFKPAESVVP